MAVFRFRNQGDKPVRIVSLDPSCGCITAEPSKEVYAPGESGEIRVEMAIAGNVGHLRRSIAVETDDAAGRFVDLTLSVDVPEPVSITPRFLFWRVGDRPEQKQLEIVVSEPEKVRIDRIEHGTALFDVQLKPETAVRYRLLVKPASTQKPADAALHLSVTIGARPQVYVIYVAVK